MKRGLPIFFLLLFAAFIFFMNVCYHFCSDDCYYALQWLYLGTDAMPRHDSLLTVLRENFADGYRPIPHLFVRIFTGLLPKMYFNVANTAMLIALVLFVIRYATGSWRLGASKGVLAIAAVYLFLCKGESYLWCAGSLNYLWVAVPTLGFLILRSKIEESGLSATHTFGAGVFALFCGCLQEACVMPVCFALCLYGLITIKSWTWRKLFVYGSYGIGAMLLLYSTIGRAISQNGAQFSLIGFGVNVIKIFWGVKVLWVLAIIVLFKPDRNDWVRENKFELMIIFGSLLMISIVGFSGERSLYAANLLGVVLLVRTVELHRRETILLSVGLVALMVLLVPLAYRIHNNFESFLDKYRIARDGVSVHERVNCGILGRFFHQVVYGWQQEGHTLSFANFYGNGKPVYGLSRHMYENLYLEDNFCIAENKLPVNGDFYAMDTQNAIVMPLAYGQDINPNSFSSILEYEKPRRLLDRIMYEIELRRNPPMSHPELFSRLHTLHRDYILLAKMPFCKETIKRIGFVSKMPRKKEEARLWQMQ